MRSSPPPRPRPSSPVCAGQTDSSVGECTRKGTPHTTHHSPSPPRPHAKEPTPHTHIRLAHHQRAYPLTCCTLALRPFQLPPWLRMLRKLTLLTNRGLISFLRHSKRHTKRHSKRYTHRTLHTAHRTHRTARTAQHIPHITHRTSHAPHTAHRTPRTLHTAHRTHRTSHTAHRTHRTFHVSTHHTSQPGRRMDADGSIVYRWNHTFRIQEETDKVEPTVYADTRIPYTAFPCGSERFRVYMIFQGFPGFSRVIPGLSRVILGGLSRVIYSYTGLSRVYTGFIQGYLGLFSQRG